MPAFPGMAAEAARRDALPLHGSLRYFVFSATPPNIGRVSMVSSQAREE
jgi:hypothetical protein